MSQVNVFRNIVSFDNIEIFYFDTKTSGDAIVCLHGRWGRAESWIRFMQHYGEKYRIIAPDQRGHGLSGKPVAEYTAEEMASDILALMDHLNIDSVILVGHSMGGYIAGYLAATYPERVRGLALLDKAAAGPERGHPLPPDKIEPLDPLTKDWPLPFSSLTEARDYIKREMVEELDVEYFVNSLVEDVEGVHMRFSSQAMAANIANYANWYDLLPKITCPALLVRAGGGEAVSDEDYLKMQASLSNCLAFEVSDPDHNVHLSKPDEFYGYFDRFLSKMKNR